MASSMRRSKSFDNLSSICIASRPAENVNSTVEFRPSKTASLRTMHNKCVKNRVQLGEKVVRVVSFFASHPSMCPEEQWKAHKIGRDLVLIDSYTSRIMAECECQFLVDPDDTQDEPSIVAVEMLPLSDNSKVNAMDKDELSSLMKKASLT